MRKEDEKFENMDFKVHYSSMSDAERVAFREKFLDVTRISYPAYYWKMRHPEKLKYRDKKDISDILGVEMNILFPGV